MQVGKLCFVSTNDKPELLAQPVRISIQAQNLKDVLVTSIDSTLADTAAFCEYYDVGLDISANCVIVEAKRAEKVSHAACMILATERVDVNNVVRRHLDARKISFASMDKAVSLTGMEYGGITPIGLPADWPILVDESVAVVEWVVVGSGIRGSKLLVPGRLIARLPNAAVVKLSKTTA